MKLFVMLCNSDIKGNFVEHELTAIRKRGKTQERENYENQKKIRDKENTFELFVAQK